MRIGEYPPFTTVTAKDQSRPEVTPAAGGAVSLEATDLFAAIGEELAILLELGIGKPYLERAALRAVKNGTTVEQELLADGCIREDAYYGALARMLRLPYIEEIRPALVADDTGLDSQLIRPTTIRVNHSQRSVTVIVPEARRIGALRDALQRQPALEDALAVSSPSAVRHVVWDAGATRRVRNTVNGLFEWQPKFSARVVFSGNQGFYAGIAVSACAAALFVSDLAFFILHATLSIIYLAGLMLRMRAVHLRRHWMKPDPLPDEGNLPVYTVLVALYRETEVICQLVAALKRLDWPVSQLDIKMVCEADDHETIGALRASDLGPQFEIVEVPAMHPRTKPKALTYALCGARGQYLAVYDAEDRPHPDQLREAHARFRTAPDDVACLQAPLIIANANHSWISALFSLEYSALFRALLPMLAKSRMPLPLGGTSNHFRTDILRANGGWDPFNVTEDADLGMRLYRLGYRSEVIQRQTLEDAPTRMDIWMKQRTRWFKGWLQTWLVMMRNPRELRREMGMQAFLIFHLLIGGMLVSSLAHPLMLAFFGRTAIAMMQEPATDIPLWDRILFIIDFVNIFGSYAIFIILGTAAMIAHEKKQVGWRWIAVPFYWMMVSVAAWRAAFELRGNPFHWHKTPHSPSTLRRANLRAGR